MAIAQALKGGVEVAASGTASLKHTNGDEAPQPTHPVDWHHSGCVLEA